MLFGKQRPELSLGKHLGFSGVPSRIIASFCILVKSLHVEGSFTDITGMVDDSERLKCEVSPILLIHSVFSVAEGLVTMSTL